MQTSACNMCPAGTWRSLRPFDRPFLRKSYSSFFELVKRFLKSTTLPTGRWPAIRLGVALIRLRSRKISRSIYHYEIEVSFNLRSPERQPLARSKGGQPNEKGRHHPPSGQTVSF